MMRTRQWWMTFCKPVFVLFLCSLAACATTGRYITTPSAPPPDLGIAASTEELRASLDYVLIPNGPGAWVKEARWDEYVLTIRNFFAAPFTVDKIRLIDPRGLYMESTVNPWQLEKMSETLLAQYQEAGIAVAVYAAPTAITGIALGVGGLGAGAA